MYTRTHARTHVHTHTHCFICTQSEKIRARQAAVARQRVTLERACASTAYNMMLITAKRNSLQSKGGTSAETWNAGSARALEDEERKLRAHQEAGEWSDRHARPRP